MWEEEKFALRLKPDESHYLVWLGLGLLFFSLQRENTTGTRTVLGSLLLLVTVALLSFSVGLYAGVSAFIFCAGVTLCCLNAVLSVCDAVGLILILYVCRPWEVVSANEWWMQIPRQCIWIWAFALLSAVVKKEINWQRHFKPTKGLLLALGMGIWCLLTTFVSGDPAGSQSYFIDTLFRAMTLVVILHLTVKSTAEAARLQLAFATGVATLSVFSLWRFMGFDQPAPLDLIPRIIDSSEQRLEAVGSLGNSNDIAAVILIPLGFLWPALLSKNSSLIKRLFALTAIAVLLKALLASQSRGALIATAAQCGLFAVAKSKRPGLLSLVLCVLVGLVGSVANQVMGRHADDLDASTESRMNYYVTGLFMALYSPIWGQGFGRYPYEFEHYSRATLHEWGLRTAHSSWVLVLAETGLVGLILFAWIHVRAAQRCWQLRHTRPQLLLAFSGYSITILFLSHSWLMFPWILFSLIEIEAKFAGHEQQLQSIESKTIALTQEPTQ
ncbi:O-antigen ligase family protein [bacterium]|nr:O-antigen ligase family protein [bacterium]